MSVKVLRTSNALVQELHFDCLSFLNSVLPTETLMKPGKNVARLHVSVANLGS